MEALSWGIIGCGDVTEVKSGPAFQRVEGSALAAVMRRDGEKARDYARRHGVPRWYNDAGHLIGDPDVNAVYIATPPSTHADYAVRCLEAGKPVYLEKPMARSAREANRILESLNRYGGKLSVAHYRRAQPMFLEIGRILQGGEIGEIRFVSLRMLQPAGSDLIAATEQPWRVDPSISGGGLFHDLAPHQLDLMLYYFGPVAEARGFALNQAGLYAADDLVAGQLRFEKGILFQGIWCFSVPSEERTDCCEIVGSLGTLRFSVFGSDAVLTRGGESRRLSFPPLQHVQQPMIEKVCAYFRDEGPNPCSAEEALASMELIDVFTSK